MLYFHDCFKALSLAFFHSGCCFMTISSGNAIWCSDGMECLYLLLQYEKIGLSS